ncbi:MAG: PaaI family thioesterase [archaeon]|nr:PaaI family thioesterase [archaeon]
MPSKGEGDQSVVYYLKVVDKHCNALGNMHGGCIATLLDDVTSFSMRDGSMSVSVDLTVSYLRAIPNNSEIHVSGTLVRKGRSLAFMTGKITCAKHPSLVYASCAHTKYIMGASKL